MTRWEGSWDGEMCTDSKNIKRHNGCSLTISEKWGVSCPRNLGWPQVHLAWAVGKPDGRAIWKDSDSWGSLFTASELNHPWGEKEVSEFTAEGQVEKPKKDWPIRVMEVRTEREKARVEVQVERCSNEQSRLQTCVYNKIHTHAQTTSKERPLAVSTRAG